VATEAGIERRGLGLLAISRPTLPPGPPVRNGAAIPKPINLDSAESEIWDWLIEQLRGVATERDSRMLAEMVRWWARLEEIWIALRGETIGTVVYNRAMIAAGIAQDKVDKIGIRFGLTPTDRARLPVSVASIERPAAKVATRPRTKLDGEGPPPDENRKPLPR
jgi:hypothetical protein